MHGFACNSRYRRQRAQKGTGYLSPFSKLVKGNGAPHANSVTLHAVLNYSSEIC